MAFLTLSPAGRRYGRWSDNPFSPARKLRALPADPSIVLPATAMGLCAYKGPTRNQGNEGSCTGQAGAEKIDLDYRQFSAGWPDRSVAAAQFEASAEFVYLCNLIADGDLGTDAGSTLHQTAITLSQKGACTNADMPYSDSQYSTAPTAAQYTNGLLYRMDAYHFLPDLPSMKACLAPSTAGPGHSFIFGINVYSSFEGTWPEAGFMPVPNLSAEQLLGGHAQHVIAYDDTIEFPDGSKGGLFVQNSWGDQSVWAQGINAPGASDGGCYWMPYAFVTGSDPSNGPFVSDAWINHTGAPWR
jgi:C1A family cysteine protease